MGGTTFDRHFEQYTLRKSKMNNNRYSRVEGTPFYLPPNSRKSPTHLDPPLRSAVASTPTLMSAVSDLCQKGVPHIHHITHGRLFSEIASIEMGDLPDRAMERTHTHTQCAKPQTAAPPPLHLPANPAPPQPSHEEGEEAAYVVKESRCTAGGKDGRSPGKQHSFFFIVVRNVDNLGLGQLR